jgi:hypothetical protein
MNVEEGTAPMKDLPKAAKQALQTWAKVIAMHVRNEMEDFHCRHLSDDQMRELNPIIRKAVYQTLRQLYFLKKGTQKQRLIAIQSVHYLFLQLPTYWEDPDLTQEERADEDRLAEMDVTQSMGLLGSERSGQAFGDFFHQQLGVFD